MYEALRKKLENISKSSSVLLVVPSDYYSEVNIFLLRFWSGASSNPLTYVSLHRPYNNLLDNLSSAKIDPKKLFLIDCVTKNEFDIPNCYFLKTQKDLKNIDLAISSVIRSKKSSMFFIDSINSLLLCNRKETVIKFTDKLLKRIKSHKIGCMIVCSVDNENKDFVEMISKSCDTTIDIQEFF